jgi:two-component system cell cycle response regulator DivK
MAKRATPAKRATRPPEAPAASAPPVPTSRGVVLLADDSLLTCELFGEYLTCRGFDVVFAHDGETAARLAIDARPSVIVMDLSMPRLDGVAAIRRLKENGQTQRVPVIVLTGHVAETRREEALAAGAAEFLIKPCLPDEIERVIGDVLQRAA